MKYNRNVKINSAADCISYTWYKHSKMISHNLPTKSAGGSDLASDQILRHRDEIIIGQFSMVGGD